MAVPLWDSKCRDSETDEDWVLDMIRTPYQPSRLETHTYIHLLRAARRIFGPEEFEWLIPRDRSVDQDASSPVRKKVDFEEIASLDPVAMTEAIAYDFLLQGGKRARPFVTLATYDAMKGGRSMGADGAEHAEKIPDPVRRVAAAIEVFHKASLVHDDIEDGDAYRYGRPTVDHQFGTPTAINVGDFLIGLGYRIIAGQRERLGPAAAADIVAQLAEAHLRLCEGQGAELAWRDTLDKQLTVAEAIRIYSLKTSPAFEAALYAGLRMAGEAETYRHAIGKYAYHLGVAFQILNDLEDWKESRPNRLAVGSDALGGRPTVLWALALEQLGESDRQFLLRMVDSGPKSAPVKLHGLTEKERLARMEILYNKADAFEVATRMVDDHHRLARGIAQKIEPTKLSNLLQYLADSILDR
jgi:geranylgeranyl pyrophosphate synthase